MIDFLSIVLLIFGVLQIILFFKLWIMTNNVNRIKNKVEKHLNKEDGTMIEAQIKALDGRNEEAFALYQRSFYLSVIIQYNKRVTEYGDHENEYSERDLYYKKEYESIIRYYSKRVSKLNMDLPTNHYDSYKKVNAIISKL